MLKTVDNFPARTKRNHSVAEAIRNFEQEKILKNCWIAGRIVGLLDDGFVLQDESGRMEIEEIGKIIVEADGFCFLDQGYKVGDIIELEVKAQQSYVKGRGSIVMYSAKKMNKLVSCLTDFYIRREDPNYLKMVIDLRLKEFLLERSKIIKAMRDFFWEKDFTEVETPELVKLPGMEPYLDVFKTRFTGLPLEGAPPKNEDLYLITSPEYAMKKLLVAGHEKIFQITKSFRNKEHESMLHNPEFTMIEWYRAYASYEEIMQDVEDLVSSLAEKFLDDMSVIFTQRRVNLTGPWEKIKVKDLFKKYANIDYEDFEDVENFRKVLKKQGYKVTALTPYEDLFFMVFLNVIEPNLGLQKPTIVYEYPAQMAALSKKCEHDSKYAERFEVYIAGMELCNAFTELNDAKEQKSRLEAERAERQKLGKDDYPVDQSFIRALEFGMPPSGGVALGVDRLVMLLTGVTDIRDILYFPHRDL